MIEELKNLEDAALLIEKSRKELKWIDNKNPVWLKLYHAENYIGQRMKDVTVGILTAPGR